MLQPNDDKFTVRVSPEYGVKLSPSEIASFRFVHAKLRYFNAETRDAIFIALQIWNTGLVKRSRLMDLAYALALYGSLGMENCGYRSRSISVIRYLLEVARATYETTTVDIPANVLV